MIFHLCKQDIFCFNSDAKRRSGGRKMKPDKKGVGNSLDKNDLDPDRRKGRTKTDKKECLSQLFNFSCVLRGEVKYIEQIKDYIVQEFVNERLVNLVRPTYDKNEIYIITRDEWEEYQRLKKKDHRLIGYY
jgi:hypothetical protein